MPTTTTNYSFYKPLVNDPTDEDLWGGYLNDNSTSLDSLLKTASDFVTRTVAATPVATSTSDRNKLILIDSTAAATTVNLLAAATAGDGFAVIIKKTDATAFTVTIDPNGAETIDGVATYVISTQYDSVMMVTNGTNWSVAADVKTVASSPKGSQAILTGAGNFTTPSNTTASTLFKFTLTGGGGAGAEGAGGGGAGGGAGSTAIYYATGLSASQACAYSIGSGGVGTSGAGGNGGASTLTVGATTVTSPSGFGALPYSGYYANGGVGGSACTNATLSIEGGGGSSPATATNATFSGAGGASFWGGGGESRSPSLVGASNGKAWGSGGSGAYSGSGIGGNGKSGVLLVEWY